MAIRLSPLAGASGLFTVLVALAALTGCQSDNSNRRSGDYDGPSSRGQGVVVIYEDDYDYYPAYETYYSRSRREYVYRDGGRWVRRSEPSGISLNVLLSAPSVRMDFRDAPEQHHRAVVQSYPRNWRPVSEGRNDRREEQQAQQARENRRQEEHRAQQARDNRKREEEQARQIREANQRDAKNDDKKAGKPDDKHGRKDDKKPGKSKDGKDGDEDDDDKNKDRKDDGKRG